MSLDREVAELRRRGDLEAAATLAIRSLGPEILGYLTALMHNANDASEVFSQFAEDLWRGLDAFRAEASLRTWSYRLARHAALRHRRDPYRRRGERLETTKASAVAGSVLASTVIRYERRAQQLARLRSRLEEDEQTLLILRVDRGLSWSEVAEVLGSEDGDRPDEAALRKRFERLKDKLAKAAREEGLIE
jgi:RNA polymerase sigma-70 factor (ECF subfamily)